MGKSNTGRAEAKEIEEGGGVPHHHETKGSENQDEIFQKIRDFIETDHTDK